jgi:ABC-type sugar transport system substrate-binding protein
LIFFGADTAAELKRVRALAKALAASGALWIVYPKGRKDITEVGVIHAGRAAGLKDVKVVGFSATHTALRFVIPVAKR